MWGSAVSASSVIGSIFHDITNRTSFLTIYSLFRKADTSIESMPTFANWLGASFGADWWAGGTYVLIHLMVFVSLDVMAGGCQGPLLPVLALAVFLRVVCRKHSKRVAL